MRNPWVWTSLAEFNDPHNKEGEKVPKKFLVAGYKEYHPYHSLVIKGYVRRNGR